MIPISSPSGGSTLFCFFVHLNIHALFSHFVMSSTTLPGKFLPFSALVILVSLILFSGHDTLLL